MGKYLGNKKSEREKGKVKEERKGGRKGVEGQREVKGERGRGLPNERRKVKKKQDEKMERIKVEKERGKEPISDKVSNAVST